MHKSPQINEQSFIIQMFIITDKLVNLYLNSKPLNLICCKKANQTSRIASKSQLNFNNNAITFNARASLIPIAEAYRTCCW